jgi:hypothetical protein
MVMYRRPYQKIRHSTWIPPRQDKKISKNDFSQSQNASYDTFESNAVVGSTTARVVPIKKVMRQDSLSKTNYQSSFIQRKDNSGLRKIEELPERREGSEMKKRRE